MAAKLSLVMCVVAMCTIVNMGHGASPSLNIAPAPAVECSSLVVTLADCLTYVTNGSTIAKPEGSCCSGLKNVLKTAPKCLCEALKSSAQFGVVLNVTKAKTLPAACNLSAASVGDCELSASPAVAPGSTDPSGEISPATAKAPAPTPGKNSASELHPISALSVLISLLVAAFSTF